MRISHISYSPKGSASHIFTILLLCILTFPISNTLSAQTKTLRSIGLSFGITCNRMFDEYGKKSEPRWGFLYGVQAELFDGPFFTFAPKIVYRQTGYFHLNGGLTSGQSSDFYKDSSDVQYDYLEIHLQARWKHSIDDEAPYIAIGPKFNFLLSHSVEEAFNGITTAHEKSFDISRFGFGLAPGIGLTTVKVSSVRISIELNITFDILGTFFINKIYGGIDNYSSNASTDLIFNISLLKYN